jgi:hypothetical protein
MGRMGCCNEEGLRVTLSPQISDRIHTLAAEYSVSTDLLINLAAKRLLDDVELFRELRAGKIKSE